MSALLQEIRGTRRARQPARAAAPLQKCSDAIELDTTHMTVDEAVAQVLNAVSQQGGTQGAMSHPARGFFN